MNPIGRLIRFVTTWRPGRVECWDRFVDYHDWDFEKDVQTETKSGVWKGMWFCRRCGCVTVSPPPGYLAVDYETNREGEYLS